LILKLRSLTDGSQKTIILPPEISCVGLYLYPVQDPTYYNLKELAPVMVYMGGCDFRFYPTINEICAEIFLEIDDDRYASEYRWFRVGMEGRPEVHPCVGLLSRFFKTYKPRVTFYEGQDLV